MELSVIQIGNSKGLRLTKSILETYNIKDKVELILEKEQIILRPITSTRKGWDDAFKELHENGEDHLLMNDIFKDENFEASEKPTISLSKLTKPILYKLDNDEFV